MKAGIRTVSILIIPVFVIYTLACLLAPTLVYASDEKITRFSPETIEAEPVAPPKAEKKSISWWWYLLGAAAVGGIVAASSGGDGGGSSKGGGGTGTVTATW